MNSQQALLRVHTRTVFLAHVASNKAIAKISKNQRYQKIYIVIRPEQQETEKRKTTYESQTDIFRKLLKQEDIF